VSFTRARLVGTLDARAAFGASALWRRALLALVCALCALAPSRPHAQQRPKRAEFGSSLGRLKWDPSKKASAEAGADASEGSGGTDEDEVVRVESTLVTTDVLVLDKESHSVRGLTRDDFVVAEEGRPQPLMTFAPGDDARRPRSVVLVIDYSGSQLPYLKTSVEAAKVLVDQLHPADQMAVVTDDVSLLADFTQDKAKLKKALDSLRERADEEGRVGASRQYSALMAALRELVAGRERPIVIFQTDGDQLPFLQPLAPDAPAGARERAVEFGLADVVAAAERGHVTVYNIVPGQRLFGLPPDVQIERAKATLRDQFTASSAGERERARMSQGVPTWWFNVYAARLLKAQTALEGLSKLTGGWTEFLEEPGQAAQVYARILSDINNRYVLGFQPTDKAHDGRRHKVSIEVRGHPEYTVWGRKSYYAPGS
jgi:Ca-activated chloride channel family protein